MTDIVDTSTRSRMMAAIGPRNTAPEMVVRRYLHAAGLRFRLHARELPGTPDLVLPKYRVAIFVNGCFWHRHSGCRFATTPSTRTDFWGKKFARNVERDLEKNRALKDRGWRVLTFWECQARDADALDKLFWMIVAGDDQ